MVLRPHLQRPRIREHRSVVQSQISGGPDSGPLIDKRPTVQELMSPVNQQAPTGQHRRRTRTRHRPVRPVQCPRDGQAAGAAQRARQVQICHAHRRTVEVRRSVDSQVANAVDDAGEVDESADMGGPRDVVGAAHRDVDQVDVARSGDLGRGGQRLVILNQRRSRGCVEHAAATGRSADGIPCAAGHGQDARIPERHVVDNARPQVARARDRPARRVLERAPTDTRIHVVLRPHLQRPRIREHRPVVQSQISPGPGSGSLIPQPTTVQVLMTPVNQQAATGQHRRRTRTRHRPARPVQCPRDCQVAGAGQRRGERQVSGDGRRVCNTKGAAGDGETRFARQVVDRNIAPGTNRDSSEGAANHHIIARPRHHIGAPVQGAIPVEICSTAIPCDDRQKCTGFKQFTGQSSISVSTCATLFASRSEWGDDPRRHIREPRGQFHCESCFTKAAWEDGSKNVSPGRTKHLILS